MPGSFCCTRLGMQLTNIPRDAGEDLGRDRIYLPMDVMSRYHYHERDLKQRQVTSEFIRVWEHLTAEAEGNYDKAMKTINEYPLHARAPVKAAGHIYRAVFRRDQPKKGILFF
ncbi:phytoene/squalene synthase family protein [Metabacillus idriensis]|uniref:phytoene/squalene synthase family protein n=1 Tax=Metabacillus idriensis TaxID=324768 RepID=UPI00174DBDBA|nr:squalene/phytoene synthase family protein [Metabacillus idriensis]